MAQLASIRQMSGQVSRGSTGEYQADERAGVARHSWRVSDRKSQGRIRYRKRPPGGLSKLWPQEKSQSVLGGDVCS